MRFDVGFPAWGRITVHTKTQIVRVVSGTHRVDVVPYQLEDALLDAIQPQRRGLAMMIVYRDS